MSERDEMGARIAGAPGVSGQEADELRVRVCDCGVIAAGWAQAKCGRNRRLNIRMDCPTCVMTIVSWEVADNDRTTAEEAYVERGTGDQDPTQEKP
jgi:hypothetical protein